MSRAPSCPGHDEVVIWLARTDEIGWPRARVDRAIAWLDAGERARFTRFRHDADRHMFLLGRVMARRLVGAALGVDPTAWRWREGERGRPDVDMAGCPISFNLAHSAGVVVCAVACGRHVGVDVEHRKRPPTDPRVVRRFCSDAEALDIERHGPDGWRDQFLRYWTLKEAYLKARGVGIGVPLADVSFSLGDPVRVTFANSLTGSDTAWAFALDEQHDTHLVAAAASATDGRRPRFIAEAFGPDLLP